MTKRAFIIICLLMIVPLLLTGYLVYRHLEENPVVAKFGGNTGVIFYRGKELHAVPGDDVYLFRFGEYLGKVEDKVTGASLYRVRDDTTDGYFAISDGKKSVLYTMTGTIYDGFPTDDKGNANTVTRVIINDFTFYSDSDVMIADFIDFEEAGSTVEFRPSEFVEKGEDDEKITNYRVFSIRYCYDGSAVSRKTDGFLYYFTETKSWIYVTAEKYAEAVAEYGESSDKLVLSGTAVADSARSVNLRAALVSSNAEKTEENTETEAVPEDR